MNCFQGEVEDCQKRGECLTKQHNLYPKNQWCLTRTQGSTDQNGPNRTSTENFQIWRSVDPCADTVTDIAIFEIADNHIDGTGQVKI